MINKSVWNWHSWKCRNYTTYFPIGYFTWIATSPTRPNTHMVPAFMTLEIITFLHSHIWIEHEFIDWLINDLLFILLRLPFSSACVMRYVYNRLWHPRAVGDGGWTNAPCTAVEIFASPNPHVTVIQMIRNTRGCLEVTTVSYFHFKLTFHTSKQQEEEKKIQYYHLITSNELIPNGSKWIDAVATQHNWN